MQNIIDETLKMKEKIPDHQVVVCDEFVISFTEELCLKLPQILDFDYDQWFKDEKEKYIGYIREELDSKDAEEYILHGMNMVYNFLIVYR